MSVKLDLIARGATAAFDRNSPQGRQDKWMLEVERAMLTSARPHAPVPYAPVMADIPVADFSSAQPAGTGMPLRSGAQAWAAGAAGRGAAPDAGPDRPAHGPHDGAPRRAATDARAIGAAAEDQPADVPGDAAQAAAAQGAAASAPVPLDGQAPVRAPALAATDSGYGGAIGAVFAPATDVSDVFASAGTIGAVRAALAGAASAPVMTQIGPAAAASMLPGLAPGPGAGASDAWGFMTAGVPAEEEHEPAAPVRRAGSPVSAQTEREPYAPSNIHVIDGEDGMHAWIRDARMTPRQEQAVAQAVIAGFVQQGTLVGSVTVNGRLHGARGDAERDDEHAAGPSISEPPSSAEGTTIIVRGAA
jgi:hypothetical protein